MSRLTEAQRGALEALRSLGKGFYGPRPGSNAWPLLRAPTRMGDVAGEMIEGLARAGMIAAEPHDDGHSLSADIDREEVKIDLNHGWRITPAGLSALADPSGGGKP